MSLPEDRIDLASYRIESALDRLEVAEKLYESGDFRDSVSRSYYAIYTAARALLATKHLDSKKHSGVISLFNQNFVKTGILRKEMSYIIQRAIDSRKKSDYEDYAVISESEASYQLEQARVFLSEIEIVLDDILS